MAKLDRRTFIKFLGGFTAVLGLGIPSQNALAQTGRSKTRSKKPENEPLRKSPWMPLLAV